MISIVYICVRKHYYKYSGLQGKLISHYTNKNVTEAIVHLKTQNTRMFNYNTNLIQIKVLFYL